MGEADAADRFVAEGGGVAVWSAVPPVPEIGVGGAEGDADAAAVVAGARGDGAATVCGIGGYGPSRIGAAGCGCGNGERDDGVLWRAVVVRVGNHILAAHEGESYARVCVGCLHVEGLVKSVNVVIIRGLLKMGFGTRRKGQGFVGKSKKVQIRMSG